MLNVPKIPWQGRGRTGVSWPPFPFSESLSSCFISFENRKQGSEDNLKCNDMPNMGEEELLS